MKTKRTPYICMLLVLFMLLAPLSVGAADNIQKVEAVFAQLTSEGELERVFVVNHFDLEEAKKFSDYGDYISINRLTDIGTIEQDQDECKIESGKGRFYYQGELDKKELPWQIAIEATIDGERVDMAELGGMSGKLELSVGVAKVEGYEAFNDSFAIQIAVSLPFERSINVEAENGTIAMAENANTVTFMNLPSQEETFTVRADVNDFAMPGISISAVPMNFDIDPSSFFASDDSFNMDQLFDAITKLSDGGDALRDGASELNDGYTEIQNGFESIHSSGQAFVDGTQDLRLGMADYRDGVGAYVEGVAQAADAVSQLADGATALGDGLMTLADEGNALISGAEDIGKGLDSLSAGLSGMTSSPQELTLALTQLTDGSTQLSQGLTDLKQGLASYGDGVSQLAAEGNNLLASLAVVPESAPPVVTIKAWQSQFKVTASDLAADPRFQAMLNALASQSTAINENVTAMINIKAGVTEFAGALNTLSSSLQPIQDGLTELSDSFDLLKDGILELATQLSGADFGDQLAGLDALKNGVQSLLDGQHLFTDGLTEYVEGIQEAADGMTSAKDDAPGLSDGLAELGDGLALLSGEGSQLRSGATDLRLGTRKLEDGLRKYLAGIAEAVDGASSLSDGLNDYTDGVAELADGLNEFKDSTDTLESDLSTKLEDELGAVLGDDFKPMSFVSDKNENVKAIQFIMMTKPVSNGD